MRPQADQQGSTPTVPIVISTHSDAVTVDMPDPRVEMAPADARRLAEALHRAAAQAESVVAPSTTSGEYDNADPEDAADAEDQDLEGPRAPTPAALAQMRPPAETVTPPRCEEAPPEESGGVGVRFSAKVSSFLAREGIDERQIVRVVEDPDECWEGMNPGAVDAPVVAVREDVAHGVVYYPMAAGDYVISVRPRHVLEDQRRQIHTGQPRGHGGDGSSTIQSLDDLTSAVERAGLVFERTTKHGRVRDPNDPAAGAATVPLTPSDPRSWLNTVADVRRRFGVELI